LASALTYYAQFGAEGSGAEQFGDPGGIATDASGEISTEAAQEVAQQADPALLAPSTTATIEGQAIVPGLGEAEEELFSQHALTTSTVSKEAAGELAVNTADGQLSLTPLETLSTAVNSRSAVSAGVGGAPALELPAVFAACASWAQQRGRTRNGKDHRPSRESPKAVDDRGGRAAEKRNRGGL
jgi:hypothetical protein